MELLLAGPAPTESLGKFFLRDHGNGSPGLPPEVGAYVLTPGKLDTNTQVTESPKLA
jgi:hypothetical protein